MTKRRLLTGASAILILTVGTVWLHGRQGPSAPSLGSTLRLQQGIASIPTPTTTKPGLLAQGRNESKSAASTAGADFSTSAAATGTGPTVGQLTAVPAFLIANTSSAIALIVQIADPNVLPGSVTLLRLSDSDGTPSLIGTMTNTGNNNTYSITVTFNLLASHAVVLQASAGFKGQLKRVTSSPLTVVSISSRSTSFTNSGMPITFLYPDNFVATASGQSVALTDFPLSNAGGFDAGGGCEIDVSRDPNSTQQTLSDWVASHWRTDGINTSLSIMGRLALRKDFIDDVGGDPATMIAVSSTNGVYTFSTIGPSCAAVMDRMLNTASFN